MLRILTAALAALWAGAGLAHSCTVIAIDPVTGTGAVSGYVLDGRPLCYFLDRTGLSGEARLITENACFTAQGLADCTRAYAFHAGDGGFRFFVQQDRLRATHEYFTLRLTLF